MKSLFPRLPKEILEPERVEAKTAVHFDLAEQSPGRAGLVIQALQKFCLPLAKAPYLPDPSGSLLAREALADFLTSQAQPTVARQLVLTSSTSASYQQLFKLFCAPGDVVLLPSPGYPLIEHLARLEGLLPVFFPWFFVHGAWQLDVERVAFLLSEQRVGAVVLVSPATPIGQEVTPEVLLRLAALVSRAGSVLIVDEVFASTRLNAVSFSLRPPVPYAELGQVVVLNGLSKVMGLPGAKLGWISVYGPRLWQGRVLRGLIFLEDCTLGVAQGVQDALAELLKHAPTMMRTITARAKRNRSHLEDAVAMYPSLTIFEAHAGWYTMLRYPRVGVEDEAICALLLQKYAIRLQPGALFALPVRGVVLGSLLVEPAVFDAGWQKALPVLAAGGARDR